MTLFKKDILPLFFLGALIVAVAVYMIPILTSTTKEAFQNPLDDSDLKIQACPQETTAIQTKNGDTDCCRGDIENFRCRGTLECTLSPSHDGISSCLEALKARLKEKGQKQCPSKFPRYYENTKTGVKGCTRVDRLPDGTGSTDVTNKDNFCPIFDSYDKARKTNGSCVNHQLLEKLQCPQRTGQGSTKEMIGAWWPGSVDTVPNLFACKPYTELQTQDVCYDDASLKEWWNQLWPSWRQWINTAGNEWAKPQFCSVYKQLRIDKSITDAQLKSLQIT